MIKERQPNTSAILGMHLKGHGTTLFAFYSPSVQTQSKYKKEKDLLYGVTQVSECPHKTNKRSDKIETYQFYPQI